MRDAAQLQSTQTPADARHAALAARIDSLLLTARTVPDRFAVPTPLLRVSPADYQTDEGNEPLLPLRQDAHGFHHNGQPVFHHLTN
ncbi:hypothetical protein D3C75_730500 [compost metagenome]